MPAKDFTYSSQNHSTTVLHHQLNSGTELDAQNATHHETIDVGHHATVSQATVGDLTFSAQKSHSTAVPYHLFHHATVPDAQNVTHHKTITTGCHATVYQATVGDLTFSAQKN